MRVNDLYTRYYDGYTSRPNQTIEPQPPKEEICETNASEENEAVSEVASRKPKLPFNMETDDLILIAVLLLIASEGSDDFILPVILGYLLISNT